MATDLKDLNLAAQDNILSVIKMTQTSVVEAVKTMVDTVDRFTPDLPLPSVPMLDKLPSPSESVAIGFAFAERLLENQREFAESLLSAVRVAPASSPVSNPTAPKANPKAA
jgi:hypothetical protein